MTSLFEKTESQSKSCLLKRHTPNQCTHRRRKEGIQTYFIRKLFVPFSTLKYDVSMRMKGKVVKDLKSFPLLPFLICSNATSKKYSGIALSGVMLYFILFHTIQSLPLTLGMEGMDQLD